MASLPVFRTSNKFVHDEYRRSYNKKMKNKSPITYIMTTIIKMDLELRYGYVKFTSDTESPIYILVCIEAMKKYFDEFKMIDDMIPELSMEYHNNLVMINCMPIKYLWPLKFW